MRLMAVFDSVEDAERARAQLVAAGFASKDMQISASRMDDGLAAEWSGQSYENQPGQPDDGSLRERASHDEARYNEAVRSGACVLSVDVQDAQGVEAHTAPIARAGARSIWVRDGERSHRVA